MSSDLHIWGAGGHSAVVVEANGGGSTHDRPEAREIKEGSAWHVAVGANHIRAAAYATIVSRGGVPTTVIHPTASVAGSAKIGPGCYVGPGVVVEAKTSIGKGVIINSGSVVCHGSQIGDYSHIAPRSVVLGGAKVGSLALIGAGAVVMPGVSVGDGATVGAGSVATRDVGSRAVVVGTPARRPLRPTSHFILEACAIGFLLIWCAVVFTCEVVQ